MLQINARRKQEGFAIWDVIILLVLGGILMQTLVNINVGNNIPKYLAKTSGELLQIVDACKLYKQSNNGTWPANIAALQTAGYLDTAWVSNNPWGNPYLLSATGDILQVSTTVPTKYTEGLVKTTPSAYSTAAGVVTVLGQPSAREIAGGYSNIIHKTGALTDRTMNDTMDLGGNRITNLGAATNDQDALSLDAADNEFVNLTGDTMTGDLVVQSPGTVYAGTLRDKENTTYYVQPSDTDYLNTPSAWDMYIRPWNIWVSQLHGQPQYWQCEAVQGNSSACCPTGYKLLHAGLNYYGNWCEFYQDGESTCARCAVPYVTAMCCK